MIQDVLVEHYINSKGPLTIMDIAPELFRKWTLLMGKLFDQAQELNDKEWRDPTELEECSINSPIWNTIREIYGVIGFVGGHSLPRSTKLACILVSYATQNHPIVEQDIKTSRQELFRCKFEYYIAREIIAYRGKNSRIIKDEHMDRKYIKNLRREKQTKACYGGEESLKKIDFSKITPKGFEKVSAIAKNPRYYKEYITSLDERLSENFVLFYFGQISSEMYFRSWADLLSELGLNPTNRGIEFLSRKVNARMQGVLYESCITKRVLSPLAFIRMRFYQELYIMLKEVLDEKQIVKSSEKTTPWKEKDVLYVYKGRTYCHARNHHMDTATAVFIGYNECEVKLNVEHCKECGKFYIGYSAYERYRKKYKVLLGKIEMDSTFAADGQDVVLSEYSPLKLCGYSVNQQDDYSKSERQYIIAKVIEKGVLKKNEVIRYLEYFISRNGQKSCNELALSRWEEDLDFALRYESDGQAEYRIDDIRKY